MRKGLAGQGVEGAQRLVVAEPGGIAQGDDAVVDLGHETENGGKEGGVGETLAQRLGGGAGGGKELAAKVFIGDEPGQGLECDRLGAVGGHGAPRGVAETDS